uniref:Uncharacterized protein n=1 Tax=Arundo donax TaxID=35708 RepID=A0A0A9CJ09_ARUDO
MLYNINVGFDAMYGISNPTSPIRNSKVLRTLSSVNARILGALLAPSIISSLDHPSFSNSCIFLVSFSRLRSPNTASTWGNINEFFSIPNSSTRANASCRCLGLMVTIRDQNA